MEYRGRKKPQDTGSSRGLVELENEVKKMGAYGVLSIDFEFAELHVLLNSKNREQTCAYAPELTYCDYIK